MKSIPKPLWLCALALIPVIPSALSFSPSLEIAPIPVEMRPEIATHVVTGTVQRVYTAREDKRTYRLTYSIAEVIPDGIEKGSGIDLQRPVYVRWLRRADKLARIGGSGHWGWTPKAGERARMFLARKSNDGWDAKSNTDGGFNALVPNGFEKLEPLKAATPKKASEQK